MVLTSFLRKPAFFVFIATLFSVLETAAQPASTTYTPSGRPRMVAEWEPAIGVLVAWPLTIPKELLMELSKDIKLYVIVNDHDALQQAIQWMTKWKITPDRVKFITAPEGIDVSWTRDWGPHAVFNETGDMRFADPMYPNGTPQSGMACNDSLNFMMVDGKIVSTKLDDQIANYIGSNTELDVFKLPFVFTGGNVITDGQRSGFSTCVLLNENLHNGISEAKFRQDLNLLTGMDQYHIISNFEAHGIQHIDCFMKMLDDERILVQRPPKDHPAYNVYESIINDDLSKLTNAWGKPYQILRLDTDTYHGDELAAYSNSLILNKNIYVPLFNIPQDSVALRQWREAMPGYTVKGFAFPLKHEDFYQPAVYDLYSNIGWDAGDALHCRTRALWDPNMIYISVNRPDATVRKAKSYTLEAIVKDYSKGSLVPGSVNVRWRLAGEDTWKVLPMNLSEVPDHFTATLEGNYAGVTVEYYVEAASYWGTKAVMPMVAPQGYYSFMVN